MLSEASDRELGLHKLRSEIQAESSALKAETFHQENLKLSAQDELKNGEGSLLHVLNEGVLSSRKSMGDITASLVGTRAWILPGDESGDEVTLPRHGGRGGRVECGQQKQLYGHHQNNDYIRRINRNSSRNSNSCRSVMMTMIA